MRKGYSLSLIVCLCLVGIGNHVQGAVKPSEPCFCGPCEAQPIADIRAELLAVASTQVGVSEKTGNNDGEQVELYQSATGNRRGDQWCASFVAWCYKQTGMTHTGNAWSPSWFPADQIIYKPSAGVLLTPQPGDVFGVWVQSKGRVGHVGLIYEWGDDMVTTIEGNYSNKVVKQRRVKRQVYVASDWVSNQSTI